MVSLMSELDDVEEKRQQEYEQVKQFFFKQKCCAYLVFALLYAVIISAGIVAYVRILEPILAQQ